MINIKTNINNPRFQGEKKKSILRHRKEPRKDKSPATARSMGQKRGDCVYGVEKGEIETWQQIEGNE